MNFRIGNWLTCLWILLVAPKPIVNSVEEIITPTDQTYVIQLLEQRLELNSHFEEYWKNTPRLMSVGGEAVIAFGIQKPSNSQLMAALHERFNAFLTNVFARACELFYAQDVEEIHLERSVKCDHVANFLALYNRKFSATDFYTASELSKGSIGGCKSQEKTEISIKKLVYMIDELLIDLQRMNNLFMREEWTTDSVLKNLRKMSLYSEKEMKATIQSFSKWNAKPEFANFLHQIMVQRQKYLPTAIKNEERRVIKHHDDIWNTFLLFFGPNLINVQKYFLAFFKAPFKIETVDTFLIPNMIVSVSFWEHIADFENSLGSIVSSVGGIPRLENELFKAVPRVLSIPETTIIKLKWRIDCGVNYISDYEMKIIEDDESDETKIIEDDVIDYEAKIVENGD